MLVLFFLLLFITKIIIIVIKINIFSLFSLLLLFFHATGTQSRLDDACEVLPNFSKTSLLKLTQHVQIHDWSSATDI